MMSEGHFGTLDEQTSKQIMDYYYYVKYFSSWSRPLVYTSGMEIREIERFRSKLEAFLTDVVLPMGRKERRQHAQEYIRGLLMDGERKSIEPMANRLLDGDVQALQQFVNQSPWSFGDVRAPLARKVEREFFPEAYWGGISKRQKNNAKEFYSA
jgi:hypothetical protein